MKSKVVGNHTFKSLRSKRGSVRSIFIARVLLALMFISTLLPASDSVVPNCVLAADGALLPSFGTGGFVVTDFARGNDAANAVAADLRGRIIAAGSATIPGKGTDFALACYDENGNLDPSFGQGGKATADFFGANDGARGLAVQDDGKIVVSGFATNGAERVFALARYLDNGNPDPTFDQDGKVTFDLGSTSEAFKVAVQADGKIVVAGDSRPQNSLDFTLVRLNSSDGSLDSSFGNSGVVRVDFGFTDRAIDLTIDKENIFVCGIVVKTATDSDFGVARLNLNGNVNNAFDGDGKVTTDFFGKQDGAQVIRVSDEGIIAAGFATNETSDFAFAKFKRDGSLDRSFDGDGKQAIDFSGSRDLAFGLIEQPDGAIVASGWAGAGASFDTGIARLKHDGSLDTTFGQNGRSAVDTFSGTNNVAFDAVLYKDTIITAGVAFNPGTSSIALNQSTSGVANEADTADDDIVISKFEDQKFVEFTKRGPPVPAVQGGRITYTFEITNSTDREIAFKVVDFLPGGVTFQSDQNPEWQRNFTIGNGVVERNLIVPAGQTSLIALRVRADQPGTRTNSASLLYASSYGFYEGTKYTFGWSDEAETVVNEFAITEATKNGKDINVKTTGLPADSSGTDQSSAIMPNAIDPQANCPVVLFDGVEQKTTLDPDNPTTVLIVKKGYKKLAPGQTVRIRVRLCSGIETADFTYTRPR